MPDYAKGKVYAVRNTLNDNIYVGSTVQSLSMRMSKHRANALKRLDSNSKLYAAFNELGVDHFYVELIENCPCKDKDELLRAEGIKIRELDSVNKGYNTKIAGRSSKEYYTDNAVTIKKWYEDHRVEVAARFKTWSEVNHEARCEKGKAYRETNKEKINAKNREYSIANREALNAKTQAYAQAHRAELAAKSKAYYAANREAILAKEKAKRDALK